MVNMARQYFMSPSLAAAYVKFRPRTPASLIARVVSYFQEAHPGPLEAAVDVGCGSGQSTEILASHFASVTGLDSSKAQIAEALKTIDNPTISFKVCRAEQLLVPDESQQLVTAGTACHWFDMPKFFQEVDRVLVPGGVLALYCYKYAQVRHPYVAERLSETIKEVYINMSEYWENMVAYCGNGYNDPRFIIPYPGMIRDETHQLEVKWTVADVANFITSWSSFHHFKDKNGEAAGQEILNSLKQRMITTLGVTTGPEDTQLDVIFPYSLIMARKPHIKTSHLADTSSP